MDGTEQGLTAGHAPLPASRSGEGLAKSATAAPRHQRSIGDGRIGVRAFDGRTRLATLRQEGSARIGLPCGAGRAGVEAVLINTSGGMTGGDRLSWSAEAGPGAALTLTTQACERIYDRGARGTADGEEAKTRIRLSVGAGARLLWLPQETILYDRAAFRRSIEADIAQDGELLLVEPIVFGRIAMGETVRQVDLRDDWRLRAGGRLLHAEALRLGSAEVNALLDRPAIGGAARAFATLVLVSTTADGRLATARQLLRTGPAIGAASLLRPQPASNPGAASPAPDRLVCRLAATTAYDLRKTLVPLIRALSADAPLPRCWSL